MSLITKRNIETLLADGEGSLRTCLERSSTRRNGRDTRIVGFQYEETGGIVAGSFTLTKADPDAERGRGNLIVEYDTTTYALRIARIYTSERGWTHARHELESTACAYNAHHAMR